MTQFNAEWSLVRKWDPEERYSAVEVKPKDAESMIKATERLLEFL